MPKLGDTVPPQHFKQSGVLIHEPFSFHKTSCDKTSCHKDSCQGHAKTARLWRSSAAPGSDETSIEALTSIAVGVYRIREVDYLSQAVGEV